MAKLIVFGTRPFRKERERLLREGVHTANKKWNQWKLQRVLATPPWADMGRISTFYAEARRQTERSGVLYTVGHIVPLNHPRVCGLHVHYNLVVEPAALNFSKGNAWCDGHGELFAEPEQFKLSGF